MAEQVQLRVPRAGYRLFKSRWWTVFAEGVWHNNPIFVMMLGMCSTLAVTNLLANALVMSVSVTLVLAVNSAIIAAIRNVIPDRVRMIVYMLIAATLVIAVDMALRIGLPDISRALGPYVALIITNCLLMGRAEAFAVNNPVAISVADSLGVGLGYTLALTLLACFREVVGFGTLLGLRVLPEGLSPAQLFSIPPGAFFTLGVFILGVNTLRARGTAPAKAKGACGTCTSCSS